MSLMTKILLIYLLLINLATFCTFGLDKWRARHNNKQTKKKKPGVIKQRIPEKILLLISALGGTIGALTGMLLFSHKTQKKKFIYLIPLLLGIHLMLFILYIW